MLLIRIVACVTLASFLGPSLQAQNAANSVESCRVFVQDFYSWYVPLTQTENAALSSDLATKQRPTAFSQRLLKLLKEDSRAQAANPKEIVGLDFDPFLNTQDPSPKYDLGDATISRNTCKVPVFKHSSGTTSTDPIVTTELVSKDGRWMFVNFHYANAAKAEDLISLLNKLREQRVASSRK